MVGAMAPVREARRDLLALTAARLAPPEVTGQYRQLVRLVLADQAQRPGEVRVVDGVVQPPQMITCRHGSATPKVVGRLLSP
jgi:hypothetical protein